MSPFIDLGDIFTNDSKNIRIIVQPPPPTTTVSPMHIPSDEIKIVKNKVVRAFPHMKISSIDQLIDALALIWDVVAVERDFPSPQNDPYVKLKMEPSFFSK